VITQVLLWFLTLLFSAASSVEQVKLPPSQEGFLSLYGEMSRQDPFAFPLSDKIGALVESNSAEESENSEDENESRGFTDFDQVHPTSDLLNQQGIALSLIEKFRRSISALKPALYILNCSWKSEIK
jgi:hypothetical protein